MNLFLKRKSELRLPARGTSDVIKTDFETPKGASSTDWEDYLSESPPCLSTSLDGRTHPGHGLIAARCLRATVE